MNNKHYKFTPITGTNVVRMEYTSDTDKQSPQTINIALYNTVIQNAIKQMMASGKKEQR